MARTGAIVAETVVDVQDLAKAGSFRYNQATHHRDREPRSLGGEGTEQS